MPDVSLGQRWKRNHHTVVHNHGLGDGHKLYEMPSIIRRKAARANSSFCPVEAKLSCGTSVLSKAELKPGLLIVIWFVSEEVNRE